MIRTAQGPHPGIAVISLDRPEKRNALNADLVRSLTDTIVTMGADSALRVVVLTGSGTAFSAGADLDALRSLRSASDKDNLEDSLQLASLFEAVMTCPLPVIARVGGHAVAGGCGLAAACDLVYAVDTARLGFTEVRIGFVPAIVSVVLRRRLGSADLRDLLLTGRLVDASEAERMGLVTRSVTADRLDEAVYGAAARIARETSREAVARTKAMLVRGRGGDLGEELRAAAAENASARRTEDCIAGVDAFLDGREPPWRTAWDRAGK